MADNTSLKFVLGADISSLNKALGDAERNFKRSFGNIKKVLDQAGTEFMTIGGAIAGSLVGATVKFANTADELTEMASRTGISTTALQELGYAAKVSGTDLNGLETAVKKMQVNISNGSKAFEDLGINLDTLKKQSPDQQLKEILKAISVITDPAERAAAAVAVFGKSGTDLLPMLDGGVAGFDALTNKARELGLVVGADAVNAAAGLKDKLDTLGMQFEVTMAKLAQTEAITNFVNNMSNAMVSVGKWIEQNPELIDSAFKFGAALLAVGAALKGVAMAMALVNALTGPMGWIKLIAGVVGGGAAYYAIDQMTKSQKIEPIPHAEGGIVTRPHVGLVGEAGPEAIIPLSKMGDFGGGGSVVVNVGNYMGDDISRRALVRDIEQILNEEGRRRVHRPTETQYYSPGGHL